MMGICRWKGDCLSRRRPAADGFSFCVGGVYVATPAVDGMPKRLAVVIGRTASDVQLAFVDELIAASMHVYDGREAAFVDTQTGRYNLSAYVRAEAADAAEIFAMIASRFAAGRQNCGDAELCPHSPHGRAARPDNSGATITQRNCDRFASWADAQLAYWGEQGDPADWRKLGRWLFSRTQKNGR